MSKLLANLDDDDSENDSDYVPGGAGDDSGELQHIFKGFLL